QIESNSVKSQVPSCIPGIFPFIGHRYNIVVEHVKPIHVSSIIAIVTDQRMSPMLVEPFIQIKIVVLLCPEHSRKSLAHDISLIFAHRWRSDRIIEPIRLFYSGLENIIEMASERISAALLICLK